MLNKVWKHASSTVTDSVLTTTFSGLVWCNNGWCCVRIHQVTTVLNGIPDLNSWGGVRQRNHADVHYAGLARSTGRTIPDNSATSSYNSLIIIREGAARKLYTLNQKCADVTRRGEVNEQAWYRDTSVIAVECAWTCRNAWFLSTLYVIYDHTLSLSEHFAIL